jgi:hypothetical protein
VLCAWSYLIFSCANSVPHTHTYVSQSLNAPPMAGFSFHLSQKSPTPLNGCLFQAPFQNTADGWVFLALVRTGFPLFESRRGAVFPCVVPRLGFGLLSDSLPIFGANGGSEDESWLCRQSPPQRKKALGCDNKRRRAGSLAQLGVPHKRSILCTQEKRSLVCTQ